MASSHYLLLFLRINGISIWPQTTAVASSLRSQSLIESSAREIPLRGPDSSWLGGNFDRILAHRSLLLYEFCSALGTYGASSGFIDQIFPHFAQVA